MRRVSARAVPTIPDLSDFVPDETWRYTYTEKPEWWEDPYEPRCDVCGVHAEEAFLWCGECGNCGTHCTCLDEPPSNVVTVRQYDNRALVEMDGQIVVNIVFDTDERRAEVYVFDQHPERTTARSLTRIVLMDDPTDKDEPVDDRYER